jgi:hypothetical protein
MLRADRAPRLNTDLWRLRSEVRSSELTGSPSAAVAALSAAVRQIPALAARAESADPLVRAEALA